MALIKCSECGKEVSSTAAACPHCGAAVPKPATLKWWLWGPAGVVVAFIGYSFMAGQSPEAEEKARTRRAIEFCWSDQKRKSLDPATARLIAGACEKMEQDFRQRYGHAP